MQRESQRHRQTHHLLRPVVEAQYLASHRTSLAGQGKPHRISVDSIRALMIGTHGWSPIGSPASSLLRLVPFTYGHRILQPILPLNEVGYLCSPTYQSLPRLHCEREHRSIRRALNYLHAVLLPWDRKGDVEVVDTASRVNQYPPPTAVSLADTTKPASCAIDAVLPSKQPISTSWMITLIVPSITTSWMVLYAQAAIPESRDNTLGLSNEAVKGLLMVGNFTQTAWNARRVALSSEMITMNGMARPTAKGMFGVQQPRCHLQDAIDRQLYHLR